MSKLDRLVSRHRFAFQLLPAQNDLDGLKEESLLSTTRTRDTLYTALHTRRRHEALYTRLARSTGNDDGTVVRVYFQKRA